MQFERLRPGQTALSAEAENAVKEAVEALLNFTGADMVRTSTGFHFRGRRTASGRVSMVRVTATEDGAGKYLGQRLSGPASPTDSNSGVSQADLGDEAEEVYIINAAERDRTGHALTMLEGDRPKDFIAYYGYADPTDGKPTWIIEGLQYSDCPESAAAPDAEVMAVAGI